MKQSADKLRKLGLVIGLHGLRGDIKVRSHPADQQVLQGVEAVFLARPGEAPQRYRLQGCRPSKGNQLLQLAGVNGADQAQTLVGAEVLIDPERLNRQPGELFWFELEGARVVDRERGEIGILEGMFVTAAHGVYVIEGSYGEVLLPAVSPFTLGFDAAEHILNVDVPEGLYPEPS